MIVSDTPPFIFARVPKTASTSVSAALEPYGRRLGSTRFSAVMRRLPLPERTMGRFVNYRQNPHLSLARAQQYLDPEFFERALKFTVVRHPVDRLISHHRHVIRNENPAFRRDYGPVFENQEFDFFIDWLKTRHLPSQTAMLIATDGSFLADRVIRLEQLDTELAPVTRELGIDIDVPRLNIGGYEPPDISAGTLAKIVEIYEVDFHHLGYDPTGVSGVPDLAPSGFSRACGAELAAIGPARFSPFDTYPARAMP